MRSMQKKLGSPNGTMRAGTPTLLAQQNNVQ